MSSHYAHQLVSRLLCAYTSGASVQLSGDTHEILITKIWIQEEELDQDGVQITPPGMHLIPLPFADEIRDPPITEAHKGESFVFRIPVSRR